MHRPEWARNLGFTKFCVSWFLEILSRLLMKWFQTPKHLIVEDMLSFFCRFSVWQFGTPLSIKCYTVPNIRRRRDRLLDSRGFSSPENGKRPVFTSNHDLHMSSPAKRELSNFTLIPSCKSSPCFCAGWEGFARGTECWLGEKPGPLMQPLRRLEMRKTAAAGERMGEGVLCVGASQKQHGSKVVENNFIH